MNVLNLAHPLTPVQLEQVIAAIGTPIDQVIEVRVQFDADKPFLAQTVALLDAAGISPDRYQMEPWIVVLPSLNAIAATVLAEMHGRMGHFPTIVRLRPVLGAAVTTFEVAEIINLEEVRQAARKRR